MFEDSGDDNGPDSPSIEDPLEDLPDLTVDVPEQEGFSGDVDEELLGAFVRVLVAVNVAIFTLSLGAMLAYFRQQFTLGSVLGAIGILSLAYAYYRYRKFMATRSEAGNLED